MNRTLGAVAFLFASLTPVALASSAIPWTWLSPQPQGNALTSAASNGSTTVAAGKFGTILSKSGSEGSWQLRHTDHLVGATEAQVLWTGNRFIVAGGDIGGMLVSENGVEWDTVSGSDRLGVVESDDQHRFRLAQLQGVTLAILERTIFSPGDRTPFLRSTDHGSTWSQGWLPKIPLKSTSGVFMPGGGHYTSLTTHRGVFFAAGDEGTIATSSDGTKWTRQSLLKGQSIDDLVSNGTVILAAFLDSQGSGTRLMRSSDGKTWSSVSPSFNYTDPDYAGGAYLSRFFSDGTNFYAFDSGRLMMSGDGGQNWTQQKTDGQPPAGGISWAGVLNGKKFALGEGGGIHRLENGSFNAELGAGANGYDFSTSFASLGNIVVAASPYSSTYRISTGSEGFREESFPEGAQLVSVARVGDRIVAVARPINSADDANRLEFYETTTGLDWNRLGDGSFGGDRFALVGSSSLDAPAVLVVTDYPDDGVGVPVARVYRSSARFGGWQETSLPPTTPLHNSLSSWVSDPEIVWDGKRFLLRDFSGGLLTSEDGLAWSLLPALPEDSENFLLATAWWPEIIEESQGRLRNNYAGRFASNGDTLVVRPAKFGTWWSEYGPDIFYVYSFAAKSWRRVLASSLWQSTTYAGLTWTGSHFISGSMDRGLVATSIDGYEWVHRALPASIKNLIWSGSRVVATTQTGGVLTHPSGLATESPSSADAFRRVGLGVFPPWKQSELFFFEYGPGGDALVDNPIRLKNASGKNLTLSEFARIGGGVLALFLQDEPVPVPLPENPEVGFLRDGSIVTVVVPDYNLRTGTYLGVRLLRLDLSTGRLSLVRRIPTSRGAEIMATEKEFGVDLNGDKLIGSRIYVNGAATGANTGQSWVDAFVSLQDALDRASSGMEVWIAKGTYKPSKLPRIAALAGITTAPKLHMFELKSGVALYGGFAGGEAKLEDRNSDGNPTILSGDHAGNDQWPPTEDNQEVFHDNAYSVVLAYQLKTAARLDGLIITGGNAYAFSDRELKQSAASLLPSGDDNRTGGGIIALSSDLIIENCTIRRNMALSGGGLAAYAGRVAFQSKNGKRIWSKARPGSRLTVTDTLFEENLVPDYGFTQLVYGDGGGASVGDNYVASFRNVEFIGNSASNGGAVRLWRAAARFVNCVFYRNSAICSPELPPPYGDGYVTDGSGGALDAGGGAAFAIAGSLFFENIAHNPRGYQATSELSGGHGGAIALSWGAKGRVTTSVFSRNSTEQAGGAISLANWNGYPRGAALELYHCTLHANTGRWSGGILNYGRARLRGHGNIFYENIRTEDGTFVDLDNFPSSTSSFSSNLFTTGSTLTGNTGAGNIFRPAGDSIFEDPTKPAGPDNIWGTSDDGYRVRPGVIAPIAQTLPPDFADADGDGNVREPLPLDANGASFGSGPFGLGAYQP